MTYFDFLRFVNGSDGEDGLHVRTHHRCSVLENTVLLLLLFYALAITSMAQSLLLLFAEGLPQSHAAPLGTNTAPQPPTTISSHMQPSAATTSHTQHHVFTILGRVRVSVRRALAMC